MNIELEIEDIMEKKGSDFELSKVFKLYIKAYKESLPKLFESSQGKDFLVKHTKKMDYIISLMYKSILRLSFGNYQPMRNSIPIALVALGSYGREQLSVHSDIDLLIVYEEVDGFNTKHIIEKIFYLAVDAGLKLGHRVHTVDDLFKASQEDITIRTSLMESRFIFGSNFTWTATKQRLNNIRVFNQKEFIFAKIKEAQIRRKKYPTSMQPNIKESVGGLRDIHLIFWVAQTIYGITSIKALSGTVFSDEEYRDFRIAIELLYRVRNALHLITSKQEDRVLLEHIPDITEMLGFTDDRKMLSKVLHAQWRVNNFTQIFVKKMVREFLYEPKSIAQFRKNRISKGIYKDDIRVYASYNLKPQPINLLLNVLISLEDKPYRFDAGFLNQFTYTKISHPLTPQTYSLLLELFKRKNLYSFLKLFYDAGVLHELFSSFRKVLHLPQFDGYHHYPVDIHSIKCVEAIESIKEPFIQNLYDELSDEDKLLLKVTTLFHDSGKGRKRDHSEVGAKLIVPFAKKLQLNEDSIERSVTLIKNHTLMSSIAFKENIYNEKTLYKFMANLKDSKNLNLLYILTYADINGVGGDTYNSFNSKLLHDLYINALEISQNSDRITDASKRLSIEKRVKNLSSFKELPRTMQKKILRVESNLFFFKHTPMDILSIAKRARETEEYCFSTKNAKSLTIEIYRKIPLNITYLLATLSHLNVRSMEIFTLFDGVKYFKIDFLKNEEGSELVEIEDIVERAFDMSIEMNLTDLKIAKNEITIDCEHSLTHAEVSVHTANQKGLLAYIMSGFEKLNINIITAKIHSSKYRVKDSFLIDKHSGFCDTKEKIYEVLLR